ncbi:MAG: thioredoxin domain-containing protein [Polyangiaceae bacterium]
MRRALGLFGVRLAAILALAVSAALLVDYTSATPAFCGVNSGCTAVRQSGFGFVRLGGMSVPLPVFGLLGFALLLGVALTGRLRRFVPLVAGLGGVVGLGLFGLQWLKIGHLCSLCVTVDALSVLAAASGLILAFGAGNEQFGLRWGAWPALGVLALLAPLSWPELRPASPVPAGVQKLYQSGKINVVEFADYECPYCRMLHPLLKTVVASYPGRVNFTRLNLPLHSHEFAHGAAQAQVCAREQGKGDAMADRLFSAEDLRSEANRNAAKDLGVELSAYDQCIASGRADRIIDAESKILIDAGLQGLPTTYVGAKTIIGAQQEEVFLDAFDRAGRGEGGEGVPAPAYWLSVLAIAAGIGWVGRIRRATL